MDAKTREESHRDTLVHANKIKWELMNFPPGLRIVHYDLSELSGTVRHFSMVGQASPSAATGLG